MILGIDPGASGGFAWLHDKKIHSLRMPKTDAEILESLKKLTALSSSRPVVYVEQLTGFVGRTNPGARMFKFGKGYGFLLGVLSTLAWEVKYVTPSVWQKSLGIGTKGERKPHEWKRVLKEEAQRLFPNQRVTLAVADSLLILQFAIQNHFEIKS